MGCGAALHSASGCYSPQLPPRSKGSGHPIGSTVKLGAETNNQQDGRAVRWGTAHYVAADNGTHQPPGGEEVPLRSALVPPPPRNPQDF